MLALKGTEDEGGRGCVRGRIPSSLLLGIVVWPQHLPKEWEVVETIGLPYVWVFLDTSGNRAAKMAPGQIFAELAENPEVWQVG